MCGGESSVCVVLSWSHANTSRHTLRGRHTNTGIIPPPTLMQCDVACITTNYCALITIVVSCVDNDMARNSDTSHEEVFPVIMTLVFMSSLQW